MGNKYRLIEKGLIDFFPKKIETFIDMFCGSGVVSMNVKAEKYVLNDNNTYLIGLLRLFKDTSAKDIISSMESLIEQFGLLKGESKNSNKRTEEHKEVAKERYNLFRKEYNKNKDFLCLYLLSYYSVNNLIRFNNGGKFNAPIGNAYFNKEKHSQKIIDGCDFFKKEEVVLSNERFEDFNLDKIELTDFVYFDPPYFNTLAIYNDCFGGWKEENEQKLFLLCEELNKRGIKWGLSNTFENKGKINNNLIEWCEKNKWYIDYFENFDYSSFGKGKSNTKEVYICNYRKENYNK